MNNVFEVQNKSRLGQFFLVLNGIIGIMIYLVTSSYLLVLVIEIILGATCFLVYYLLIGRHRRIRVELFKDKMVFGKNTFYLCDVKRITILERDLRITYGKSNVKHIYNYKLGTKQEISEALCTYSNQNNVNFFDLIHADAKKEMVFNGDMLTKFYSKKSSSLKHFLLGLLIWFGGTVLTAVGLTVILGAFASIFGATKPDEGIAESYFVEALTMFISICLAVVLYAYWKAKESRVKENCMEQRQYFEGDTLKVEMFGKVGKNNAFQKYSVQRIEKVLATDYYIEVYGYIGCEIHSVEGINKTEVECVKIPRCFVNEEKILNIGAS